MSVAKTIILSAQSDQGFEAAIAEAIEKANQTLRNIEGAWVKDQNVVVKDGKIVAYRVHLEVTFVLD
jgi:dodecin